MSGESAVSGESARARIKGMAGPNKMQQYGGRFKNGEETGT